LTEPKTKKRKRKDGHHREHDREDAPADKTIDVASGQLQNSPSKENDPLQKPKEGRNDSQQKVQTTTEGAIPEKSADEKRAKKRKKEKRSDDGQPKQSDATIETVPITRPELLAPHTEVKKRKRKEKKVDKVKEKGKDKETKARIDEVVVAATEIGIDDDRTKKKRKRTKRREGE
jgi:hypothetical protein